MRVLVCQIDTRSPQFTPPPRYWINMGDTHADMHKAFRREYDAHKHPNQWNYYQITPIINAVQCKQKVGYEYSYVQFDTIHLNGMHPSWCKVHWILENEETLANTYEWVIILDTDAWIRDLEGLHASLENATVPLLLSGEPSCKETRDHHADRVNGGFYAFRPSDSRVFDFFDTVWKHDQHKYHREWPWEQVALNAAILQDEYAGLYTILPTEAVNTPAGSLVTHCWYKGEASSLALSDLLFHLQKTILPEPCRRTVELVISRYTEDISWIFGYLPIVDKITVYDKCDKEGFQVVYPSHPKLRVEKLKNTGREAHTYAYHLATHYDTLCDIVVFSQGSYLDHLDKVEFEFMLSGDPRKPRTGLDSTWGSTIMKAFRWTPESNHTTVRMQPAEMSLGKFYVTYIRDDLVPEAEVPWWQNAIFNASRSQIHTNSRDVYERLLAVLDHGDNTEYAHYMERFWYSLFHSLR